MGVQLVQHMHVSSLNSGHAAAPGTMWGGKSDFSPLPPTWSLTDDIMWNPWMNQLLCLWQLEAAVHWAWGALWVIPGELHSDRVADLWPLWHYLALYTECGSILENNHVWIKVICCSLLCWAIIHQLPTSSFEAPWLLFAMHGNILLCWTLAARFLSELVVNRALDSGE